MIKDTVILTKDKLYRLIRQFKELRTIVKSAKRKHNLLIKSKLLTEILDDEGIDKLIEKTKKYGGKNDGIFSEDGHSDR